MIQKDKLNIAFYEAGFDPNVIRQYIKSTLPASWQYYKLIEASLSPDQQSAVKAMLYEMKTLSILIRTDN
jgi:hypothetical protein